MERGYGTLDGYARCGLLCDAIETAAIVGTVSLAGQLKNTSRERSVKPACTVSLQRRKEDSLYAYMYFPELSLSRRMYTCIIVCIIYRSKNIQTSAPF